MRTTFLRVARECLRVVRPARYDSDVQQHPDVRCRFPDAGHILGSAILEVDLTEDGKATRLVLSGDPGQPGHPILRDPTPADEADLPIIALLGWAANLRRPPGRTFLVHGGESAALALSGHLRTAFVREVAVPEPGESSP